MVFHDVKVWFAGLLSKGKTASEDRRYEKL